MYQKTYKKLLLTPDVDRRGRERDRGRHENEINEVEIWTVEISLAGVCVCKIERKCVLNNTARERRKKRKNIIWNKWTMRLIVWTFFSLNRSMAWHGQQEEKKNVVVVIVLRHTFSKRHDVRVRGEKKSAMWALRYERKCEDENTHRLFLLDYYCHACWRINIGVKHVWKWSKQSLLFLFYFKYLIFFPIYLFFSLNLSLFSLCYRSPHTHFPTFPS